MSNRVGYRGYIGSRPIRGEMTPQQVQNLVIRDYANKNKLQFLLSATEYAMPGCYMILESVLDELSSIEGIILFTLFMLPQDRMRRKNVYDRLLSSGAILHAALEGVVLKDESGLSLVEDLFLVDQHAQTR